MPFTAVDVIFCRNVLIYFEKPVVAKLIESFHATLNPGGFLFLGHAESASDFGRLFRPIYTKDAFYFQRRSASENDRELDPHKALSDAFEEVHKRYEATTHRVNQRLHREPCRLG